MKLPYEPRVFLLALAAGLPGVICSLLLMWGPSEWLATTPLLTTVATLAAWVVLAITVRRHIVFPLQTLSNLVAALREGDFSIRGRESGTVQSNDTLEELIREVNALAATLHSQRLGAVEATALLGKVMEEIEVAIFTFDAERRLKLLNRSAMHLLSIPYEQAIGQTAESLGLADYLKEEGPRLFDASFAGGERRWEIRRSYFREGGLPHQLLVLSDITRALRAEELHAWQRIVRVIGHEVNNSLTPIKSISDTLKSQLSQRSRPTDWEEDLSRGLTIMGSRAEALSRFMTSYAQLARLPQPLLQSIDVGTLVRRVAGLETRIPVVIRPGPPIVVSADPDQIEQALINLIRNAVEASLQTGGGVTITWVRLPLHVELQIEDEGSGLSSTSNLFVPFFTTKPGGSGIGLVLSRQIAEAHGGSVRLDDRTNGHGCVACVRLRV